jgi:hypothetical protein
MPWPEAVGDIRRTGYCFHAVAEVGFFHKLVMGERLHPSELTEFRLINTMTSFTGTFHVLCFGKYADRCLGAFIYRFNRQFNLDAMTERVVQAFCSCTAWPKRLQKCGASA